MKIKKPHSKQAFKQAFTLIELLTVIAIIGILAGIIIPTVGAVRENAMKTKTKAMFSQWVSAMDLFRQDYGYYPSPFDFPQKVANNNGTGGGEFFNLLTGNENSTFNPKGIRYYSFSEDAVADKAHDVADERDIIDAFGNNDFGMAVDTDLSGSIEKSNKAGINELNGAPTKPEQNSIRSSVIFWTVSDDDDDDDFVEVKSWE